MLAVNLFSTSSSTLIELRIPGAVEKVDGTTDRRPDNNSNARVPRPRSDNEQVAEHADKRKERRPGALEGRRAELIAGRTQQQDAK